VLKAALDAGNLYGGDGPSGTGETSYPTAPTSRKQHPPTARCMGLRDLHDLPRHLLEERSSAAEISLRKDLPVEPQPDTQGVNVLEHLLAWARNPNAPPLFALLGEYGMGKTITCQRLALELEKKRVEDSSWPLALYFDLRNVSGLDQAVPSQQAIIEECIQRGWQADGSGTTHSFATITQLIDQGAVLILDGLDEVLVKLSEPDGQIFTNQLLKLVGDAKARSTSARPVEARANINGGRVSTGSTRTAMPRLLISCRTQYFRSLRDQQSHFTGQERGEYTPDAYRALLLLPFSEEQVRRYLGNALPEADPERLLETLRAVHNLEELTRRPYTLKLIAEFVPAIEQARAAGQVVHGVTLYRKLANRWLDRDKGKHHIKPEHKLRLAAHLAAELWRAGRRVFPVGEMEAWFHTWLEDQPDLRPRYRRLHPDQLEEDLRTATFLTRQDAAQPEDCGFRFAHTSLQEFFLAEYLLAAVRDNAPQHWAMSRPSRETLDFFGQMLAEAQNPTMLSTLQSWRKAYRAKTSELLLDYALLATAQGWPVPILHGIDLHGADLRGWKIGTTSDDRHFSAVIPAGMPESSHKDVNLPTNTPLRLGTNVSDPLPSMALDSGIPCRNDDFSIPPASIGRFPPPTLDLGPANFTAADLRETQFHHVNLDGADFTGARLDWAEFHACTLRLANFSASELTATIFRHSRLTQAQWEGLKTSYRTQFLLCVDAPRHLPQSLLAPDTAETLPRRLALLTGHRGAILACTFSPDGTRLLSTSNDGTMRLWDAASGECLRVLTGHEGWVLACDFSSDSTRLLSSGSDRSLRLWDVVSGECLGMLEGHEDWVRACTFSPDGSRLLSAGDDGTLRLWDAASGECLRVLNGHEDGVRACAFSPDSTRLLSASDFGTLALWDATCGVCLRLLTNNESRVNDCTFSSNGTWILSAGEDGTLSLWETASGECLRVLNSHKGSVIACTFSPDDTRLLSAGRDGTLRLWDRASGECLLVLIGHKGRIRACAFSSDGTRLLSAGNDGTLRLWDWASGECLRVLTDNRDMVRTCVFASDGTRLLSAGNDGILRLWDAASGECLRVLTGHEGWVNACAFSSDGARLLSASSNGTLHLWDTASGESLRVLTGHEGAVYVCMFSCDDSLLLSAGEDGTLRLWDAANGECLRVLTGHEGEVLACAFSSDGTRLLSAGDDGTLRLWDGASSECLRVLTGDEGEVRACRFADNDTRLLSAGDNGILRLWDEASGECLRVMNGHEGWVNACTFSSNGTRLLSAGNDGILSLRDATNGDCLQVLTGHEDVVRACAFSPDGSRLLSAGDDGTLRLWDAETGECLRIHAVIDGEQAGYAVWSPRENRVIEASGEAWRWLAWTDGQGGRWPLETFGPVPAPRPR